jgi:hypothetical protein
MVINIDRDGTLEGLENAVSTTLSEPGIKSVLIFSCDGNQFSPEGVDPVLTAIPKPVFGGIFPSIITAGERLDRGSLVAGIRSDSKVVTIDGLGDEAADYVSQIDRSIQAIENIQTIFAFVDGFSTRIDAFINSMFTVFGLGCNYLGGGAGSLSMVPKPCLFTNSGLVQDKAVIALLVAPSGVGVSHGWKSISGPYRVTEADHNLIRTLDWKPSFEVYRDVIMAHSRSRITEERFFDIAKSYPFGITKLDTERIVRDPIKVQDKGAIMCVGEVPEGSFVDILNGDVQSLISAAGAASKLGDESYRGRPEKAVRIFIDCISRVLFLGERFDDEIHAVWDQNQTVFGACTIGEIANSGSDFLEFYNKTAVIGILEAT